MPITRPPMLPCPECRMAERGVIRIGQRRGRCRTCNAWAQAIYRGTFKRLAADTDPRRYEQIVRQVEAEHYPEVAADFMARLDASKDGSLSGR